MCGMHFFFVFPFSQPSHWVNCQASSTQRVTRLRFVSASKSQVRPSTYIMFVTASFYLTAV